MAVTVPDWADTLLDVIGVSWPNVDEDAYRDMAIALREFAEDLEDDGQLANNHVTRLLSSGHGEAMEALNGHWTKVKDKHLKDVTSAARTIATALDTAAGAIEAMKLKALVELGILAGQTGLSMALIPVTGGLSALIGAGAIAVAKKAISKAITECMEEAVGYVAAAMTEPAVAALENLAADLVVQVGATAMDLQDGVNVDQAKQAGKDGFDEGVQGAKDAMHLASAGGGGGGGGGKGGKDGFHIEHDEHDHASTQLNGVSTFIHGKTTGKLTKAKTHHGRTRGKDGIAEVLDPVLDKALGALVKSAKTMGDHVGQTLPKAVKQISADHKKNDDDIRDRIARLRKGDDGDDGRGRSGANNSRGSGNDAHLKPASLRDTKSDPRRHGIELNKKKCENDPVDVATGEMTLTQTDLSLPGTLPLVLRRTHLSEYRYGHWFGRSWASTLDERLELDPVGTGAIWAREDGSALIYPSLPLPDGDPVLPLEGPRLPLVHGGQYEDETTYRVTDPHTGLTRSFTGSPYRTSPAYWLTELTDRNDNRVTFTRRPDGTPGSVVHSGGYTVQLTTEDARVRELALRTPEGPVTVMTYGYDALGNLDAVTNSSGLPLRFTYDPEGRITSWTDRNDSTFRYVYDAAGRVVRTIGPDGYLSSTFAYEVHSETGDRITRYTNSLGATTTYHLNDRLQVVAETDPLGHTSRSEYDPFDRLLAHTDALNRSTTYTYDGRGNLTRVVHPDGTAARIEYNDLNQPTCVTAPDDTVWRHEYDERGNHLRIIAPDGATSRMVYGAAGAPSQLITPSGERELIKTDRAGLPRVVTDPLGNVTTITRDAFGRQVSMVDASGAEVRLSWNIEGLLTSRTDPDGSQESWEYDGEGNCVAHADALGQVTRYEYGHFDSLTSRTGPDGSRHVFSYDTELRLVQVTNPDGLSWHYSYDAAGRLTGETDFDERAVAYSYDADGQLISRITPLGQAIKLRRDAMGRVMAKDVTGTVTQYTYDHAGRLLSAVAPDSSLHLERDSLGRILAETVDGRTIRYTYDPNGRRLTRVTPTGAVTRLSYDQAGNRDGLHVDGHRLSFAHDPLGRELRRTFGAPDSRLSLTSAWDAAGRLSEQQLTAGARTVTSRAYRYRADHHLIALTDRVRGTTRRYTLDPMGRPLSVHGNGWTERYAYDATGNQVSAEWPDVAHPEARGERTYTGTRLLTAGAVRYTYDAAGRTVIRRKTRLSRKADTWKYTWDAEDRLISCTTPDGARWTYRYDPLGRRIAKLRHAPDGAIVEQTTFTWDGTILVEQSDSTTGTILTWDHDGSRPLTQLERRHTDQATVDSRFFAIVTDLIGTPTELVDERGDIAWHTRATLWGTTTWNRTAAAYTPLRFPGQYADPETGLHYNYFRHYDPDTARYTAPDPLGLAPAPNPIAYVTNPCGTGDPLGLAPCKELEAPKPASAHRNRAGSVTGGGNLRDVDGRWLRGSAGNAGRVPGQVARALQGRQFKNFDDFREAFWMEVSRVPEIASQFSPSNQTLIAQGKAPFAVPEQAVGGNMRYVLHHIQPIQHGGGVYDLDNILVLTPQQHREILDPKYHMG
ncbi:DUF6531 domain-containing protein [Streptomyces sp. NPDC006368]|uniref:DUF6531 domain-containing protein n=1 Tax=Streptomyces sp. NPDC006368 TaxID=3156760 RepID=UPI0033A64798